MISTSNQSTRTTQIVGRMSNQRTLTTMNDLTPVSNPPQDEIWKQVVGYEDCYEVSSVGRVRRSSAAKRSYVGRIRKLNSDHAGYPTVWLENGKVSKSLKVHQLVSRAFIGEPPTIKHEVNHKNGIKDDNRVENLEWVTHQENMKHAYVEELASNKGERNNAAKLTWDQVREIRRMYNSGIKRKQIAKLFPVAFCTIWSITTNATWKE